MTMLKNLTITPNQNGLSQLAQHIWDISLGHLQTPTVILSTSGPTYALREHLESLRPSVCPSEITFLPVLNGLNEWLSLTPELHELPTALSEFQRWEVVYRQFEISPFVSKKLGIDGETGKWNLAQSIVQTCDYLSSAYISLEDFGEEDILGNLKNLEQQFNAALKQAYPVKHKI